MLSFCLLPGILRIEGSAGLGYACCVSGRGNPLGLDCLNGRGFVGTAVLLLRGNGSLFGLLLFLLAMVGLQGSELELVGSLFPLPSVLVSPAEVQAGITFGADRYGLSTAWAAMRRARASGSRTAWVPAAWSVASRRAADPALRVDRWAVDCSA